MTEKPKNITSNAAKELEKVEKQFDDFSDQVKNLTMDRMAAAPKQETEMQVPLSQKEIAKSADIYLKPAKAIGSREKFNERFREEYNFMKEFVHFIAENKECPGDLIESWTKPFPGVPAEFWNVPTNKPVWGPRYLAEQLKRKSYHRLVMNDTTQISSDRMGTYHGQIVADTTIQRLDARPVSTRKSIFMGASGGF